MTFISDIAFTNTVKAIQARKGSRQSYAQLEQKHPWQSVITPELELFIAAQRSFFLATANAFGQPYVQHRGGPPGFLHVIDKQHIAFADFKGNRQFISQGNLSDNPKAFIFLIDYATRKRVKIWGKARVVEDQPDLLTGLMSSDHLYRAIPEQAIVFSVDAWDSNCPQHIPVRLDYEDVSEIIREKDLEIKRLQEEVQRLNDIIG